MRAPKGNRDILDIATNPDPERERKMADEGLALQLLAGWQDGQTTTKYPKRDSIDEAAARAALARIVRDHMPGFSGELLALAIDPATPSKVPGMTPTRRVQFESPGRGKSSNWARDLLVVGHIRQALACSRTGKEYPELVSAAQALCLSLPAVKKIWERHKKIVGRTSRRRVVTK
jgi:hypothetical protein